MPLDPFEDPRDAKFQIPKEMLSEVALDSLIEAYCTQDHNLNDIEDPLSNKELVRNALEKGTLQIWFDPVTDTPAIHHKDGNPFNPVKKQPGA